MTSLTRVIDTVIHELTAPQMLERTLRLFGESREEPVYVAANVGNGDRLIRQMRVELSRLRLRYKQEKKLFPQFGFVDSKMEVKMKVHGIDVEYYQIDFRITPRQRFAMLAMQQPEVFAL